MKKINLIIISLGLGLTINLGIGYSLIIPVLIYYLKKDIKNIFYIFPTLTIAVILSNTSNLISIILLDLLVIFLVLFPLIFLEKSFSLRVQFYRVVHLKSHLLKKKKRTTLNLPKKANF